MNVAHDRLERITSEILTACGTPPEDAREVARLLVAANLMGLDSHGVIRVIQYVRDIRAGRILPGAEGMQGVMLPGEPEDRTVERRKAEGIPIDAETWGQIEALAGELSVAV